MIPGFAFTTLTDSEKLREIERIVLGPNAGMEEPDGGDPTAEERLANVQERVRLILTDQWSVHLQAKEGAS